MKKIISIKIFLFTYKIKFIISLRILNYINAFQIFKKLNIYKILYNFIINKYILKINDQLFIYYI
ncbi:hypothetical protein CEM_368 [Candidatus Johnevansia muelleri]|uniref:Uncharacterized protein n=1 Tax=Candidatus Johnevansia muelleri TaxID=1495769 RepID=A0A078KEY9_9GAMM|nr:hypothetical protein CEM_368 [Candidatus Evansia muelleri]